MIDKKNDGRLYPILSRKSSGGFSKSVNIDGFEDFEITFGIPQNDNWTLIEHASQNNVEFTKVAYKNLFDDAKDIIKLELLDEITALELDPNCIGTVCRDNSMVFIRREMNGPYWFYFLNEMVFSKSRISVDKLDELKRILSDMVDAPEEIKTCRL